LKQTTTITTDTRKNSNQNINKTAKRSQNCSASHPFLKPLNCDGYKFSPLLSQAVVFFYLSWNVLRCTFTPTSNSCPCRNASYIWQEFAVSR